MALTCSHAISNAFQLDTQSQLSGQINAFADPFLASQALQSLDGTQATINPYAEQAPSVSAQAFFQDTTSFRHPLNYHLYASLGPRRDQITPYQRTTADFFIPDDLREDLQRKAEATLQTFPNSTLPQNVDNHFHSLVALDTVNSRTSATFGYPSWIYKATSSIDGNMYALRRIEGFRLTSDQAINTKTAWKKVVNGNVVRVHDAFTTQAFGDRSLVVVVDYHPLAQTVADKFFSRAAIASRANQIVPEQEIWSYIVQLANGLKSIHSSGLAARTLVPSKVLVTSKNRMRLSGCSVLDIVQFEQASSLAGLQQADLRDLGRLIVDIAARNSTAHNNPAKALELVSRSYTDRLRACLQWLLSPPQIDPQTATEETLATSADYNVNTLISNISDHVMTTLDSSLSQNDDLASNLMTELENGRLVRLLTKLNTILERPESSPANNNNNNNNPSSGGGGAPLNTNTPSNAWSETGERYYLKLFRDYVFHQVDHEGRPVLDLGHQISCLNKLDAGIDGRIQLVDRGEQNVFIVSYRELKRGVEAAWGELSRGNRTGRR
jgi:PAB-dependent poly(A)-specific ribonuclease subunit 3